MERTLLSLFILLLISFSGHSVLRAPQEPAYPGTPVPITPLGPKRSGPRTSFTDSSGIGDRLRVVIRDRDAWRDVWQRIQSPVCSLPNPPRGPLPELPPLPEIDFSREMLVVVALGGRPSSGYAIVVDGAYEQDNRLEIVVRSVSVKGCAALAVMTAPVDIVRLPKTERAVVFRETEAVRECK